LLSEHPHPHTRRKHVSRQDSISAVDCNVVLLGVIRVGVSPVAVIVPIEQALWLETGID
jgi:hypothetical protein